jgi:hypothetical protein
MLTTKADWWITSNPTEANNVAKSPRRIIAQVLHSREEAEDWIEETIIILSSMGNQEDQSY